MSPPVEKALPRPVRTAAPIDSDLPETRRDPLAREVVERLQRDVNFTADVRFVGPGTIAGEGKTRRVIRTYRGEVR